VTDEQDSVDEPEPKVRKLPPAHPGPSPEAGEAAPAEEHTSPFPYAEKFEEWVADETASRYARQHDSAAADADS
jgi:hypothetical protein